jgi:hypothetical protein
VGSRRLADRAVGQATAQAEGDEETQGAVMTAPEGVVIETVKATTGVRVTGVFDVEAPEGSRDETRLRVMIERAIRAAITRGSQSVRRRRLIR